MVKRKTITDCIQIARENEGKCLSTEYVNSKTKMTWQCKEGHIWNTTYDSIKSGRWCNICRRKAANNKKRLSIKDVQALAEARGGKCLSTEYINNAQKLKWECEKGHVWETPYSVIKMGHWCPKCSIEKNSSNQRFTINHARSLAKLKGGECISKTYKNARTSLEWKCNSGHTWKATYYSIKGGSWCPYCAGKKSFDKSMLDKIAKEHGGVYLTENYLPGSKVKWKCKEGHIFSSRPSNAKRGHWCPHCTQSAPLTLNHAIDLAKSKGGKCLSKEYKRSSAKLKWQCGNGHIWNASYNSVNKGSWCPICSQGLGERLCRTYFESIFGVPFPNTRGLSWLVSQDGNYLELDGYNENLKLAFEHQGEHHYKEMHYFSNGVNYDALKKSLCKKHGVLLIEVPQIGKLIELNDLPTIIKNALKFNDREIPIIPKIDDIDFSNAYHPKWMDDLQILAHEKGGKCLSPTYLGDNKRLKWQCKEGHVWMSSPGKIKRGDWCDKCARIESGKRRSLGIESARESAIKLGGKCLSESYKNNRTKMTWQCKEGHIWEAIYSNIKKGHWCPTCSNLKKNKKFKGS